jgi:hypothetical protein
LPQHQEAQLLTFDRTLIDAMSLEILSSEDLAAARLASNSAGKEYEAYRAATKRLVPGVW